MPFNTAGTHPKFPKTTTMTSYIKYEKLIERKQSSLIIVYIIKQEN